MPKSIPPNLTFPQDDQYWRLDWLGTLERNPLVPSEPLIQVKLTLVDSSGTSTSETEKWVQIGAGFLPKLIIGSVWFNGICMGLDTEHMESVEFSDINIPYDLVEFMEAGKSRSPKRYEIPPFKYKVGGRGLAAKCLVIKPNDNVEIVIPTLEIVRFYYATSSKLARHILYSDIENTFDKIVVPDSAKIDEEGHASLTLKYDIPDSDAPVVARIQFSDTAFACALGIFESMQRDILNGHPASPEVIPPFMDITNLRIRGVWLNDEKLAFLALIIEECTAPFPFTALEYKREKDSGVADTDEIRENEEESKPGPPRKKKVWIDGGVSHNKEPSKNFETTYFTQTVSRFPYLKEIPIVHTRKPRPKPQSFIHPENDKKPGNTYSTGDGTFGNTDAGRASFSVRHSEADEDRPKKKQRPSLPANFETLFNVMGVLEEEYKVSFGYITLPTGSCVYDEGTATYFPPTVGGKKTAFLYTEHGQRQALIVRLTYNKKLFYLLDVQRVRNGDDFAMMMLSSKEFHPLSEFELLRALEACAKKKGHWFEKGQFKDLHKHKFNHSAKVIKPFVKRVFDYMKKVST